MEFSKRRVNYPFKTDSFFLKFLFLFSEIPKPLKNSPFQKFSISKLIEHDFFSWVWFKNQKKNKKILKFFFSKKNEFLMNSKLGFFKKSSRFGFENFFFHYKTDYFFSFLIEKKMLLFDKTTNPFYKKSSQRSLYQCFTKSYFYFSKPKFLSNLNLGYFLKKNLGWNIKVSKTFENSTEDLFFSINPEFFQFLSTTKTFFKSFLENFKRSYFSSSNQIFVSFEKIFFFY